MHTVQPCLYNASSHHNYAYPQYTRRSLGTILNLTTVNPWAPPTYIMSVSGKTRVAFAKVGAVCIDTACIVVTWLTTKRQINIGILSQVQIRTGIVGQVKGTFTVLCIIILPLLGSRRIRLRAGVGKETVVSKRWNETFSFWNLNTNETNKFYRTLEKYSKHELTFGFFANPWLSVR